MTFDKTERYYSPQGIRNSNTIHQIALFDSNPVLCQTLAMALDDADFCCCIGFSGSRNDISKVISPCQPSMVIMDPADMDLAHDYDLTDVVREVRTAAPNTRILVYTSCLDEEMLRAAMAARLSGCVSKTSELGHLKLAISAILSGGAYFDPCFAPMLSDVLGGRGSAPEILSDREREVLIRMARGLSSKQIGRELEISNKTVDTYKARAQQKLQLQDRAEMVEYVLSRGWIS